MKLRFKNVETREDIHECDITLDIEMPSPYSMVDVHGVEYFAVAMKRCYETTGTSYWKPKEEDITVLEVLLANKEQYPRYAPPPQEDH